MELREEGVPEFGTIAYDQSTGALLWGRLFDPKQGGSSATSMVVAPDSSKVIVTGATADQSGNYNYATVAYSLI